MLYNIFCVKTKRLTIQVLKDVGHLTATISNY